MERKIREENWPADPKMVQLVKETEAKSWDPQHLRQSNFLVR